MIAAMRRALPPLIALLCFLPRPASAQTGFEISGGYAVARDPRDEVTLPRGWAVAAALTLTPTFSAVADFSGQYQTVALFNSDARLSVFAAMGGLRAAARIGALTEFGQLLAGVVRASGSAFGSTTSANSFSIQPGVGLDYPLATAWAARAQLDLRLIAAQWDTFNAGYQYRFVAGLVYQRRRH
jgi:hypothetical protein